MSQNRNLFRLTRFILLKLPYLFRLLAFFRKPKKRLLIIKADAIGDYILFRNFIEVVKKSEKYKNFEIDLLGNELCRDLILKYDGQYLSKAHFTLANKIYYTPSAVFKLGWALFSRNYEVVFNPSSTRTFMTDGLTGLTAAREIIGFESNNEGIVPKYKNKTDRFYTTRLVLPPPVYFEFNRNKFFFETVLNEQLHIQRATIEVEPKAKSGIMIFPGTGVKQRGWEAEKFAELIATLLQNTTEPIYLAGGPDEVFVNNWIALQVASSRLIDITGKTSLTEIVEMIAGYELVVANDSSAIHIAAAVNTASVCVAGGGHFDRFVPYPPDTLGAPLCVYEKLECYYCNWNCIFETGGNAYPCISSVSTDKVLQAILQQLAGV